MPFPKTRKRVQYLFRFILKMRNEYFLSKMVSLGYTILTTDINYKSAIAQRNVWWILCQYIYSSPSAFEFTMYHILFKENRISCMMMMKQHCSSFNEKREFQLKRQHLDHDSGQVLKTENKTTYFVYIKVGQFNRFDWIGLSFIGIDCDEQKAFMNRPNVA